MNLQVPYIPDDVIERDAAALLAEFAHARGIEIQPPIPIEDLVEKHLKLRVEFDDLHTRLGVPRSGFGGEPDIFGAIWLESGRIVIEPAQRKEYDLAELVRGINRKNLHGEVDLGRPVGKEAL